jgi:Zn ribbon nucleic-acid-binding protein
MSPSVNDSIIHLRKRHSSLEDKSLQEFPRWSNGDYASVGVLLSEVSTLRVQLAAQRDLLQEAAPKCDECDAIAIWEYDDISDPPRYLSCAVHMEHKRWQPHDLGRRIKAALEGKHEEA